MLGRLTHIRWFVNEHGVYSLNVLSTEGANVGMHFRVSTECHQNIIFLPLLNFCYGGFTHGLTPTSLHQGDITNDLHSIELF